MIQRQILLQISRLSIFANTRLYDYAIYRKLQLCAEKLLLLPKPSNMKLTLMMPELTHDSMERILDSFCPFVAVMRQRGAKVKALSEQWYPVKLETSESDFVVRDLSDGSKQRQSIEDVICFYDMSSVGCRRATCKSGSETLVRGFCHQIQLSTYRRYPPTSISRA